MATRLHVGGLGERVKEEDLRNTFSHLGTIQTVEIIRTKGRSFAYINFLPSSENALVKLFSTYNGCLWKGGKLKLEKAKEHYMDRLKQEWAEDDGLLYSENSVANQNDDENMAASSEPKSTLDSEKMQIRMFFPKLRKVKALPFRGTGKHKYSFQRVVVPPLPVHFCDCPEHCDDIQSDKINDNEATMMNSVMNRLLKKETSLKSGCIQPPRGAQVHDSRIQDDGINEEEIHVMNSVMKKLFDREIAKTERRVLHESPKITAPTFESKEDNNETDEETDDDDIKINTGADFGPESWELQTSLLNKMARSNEQGTSEKPAKSKLGTENKKVNLSNKKRKSVSNESNEMNPASLIHRKKVRFESQCKESEDDLELKSVAESENNKSITSSMWFQKSSWKNMVGDGSSGSFHLSHITPGGETNTGEQSIPGGETSTDYEKNKKGTNVVNEEHNPCDKTLSVSKELEIVSNSVPENLDGQSSQSKDREELQAAQPAGPSANLDKVTRGSCWMQKSSWTQLVGGGKSSSFSLSQISSKDQLEKQQLNKPNNSGTSNYFFSSVTAFGGTRSSRTGFAGENKKKDAQASAATGIDLSKAPMDDDCSDATISKKYDSEQRVSSSRPGVVISETCPFMRSADSLKDWQTAKTTLTGANKKRNNSKQGFAL